MRVLGPIERYYVSHDSKSETTDVDIYSYHRSLKKNEKEALKRVEYVLEKLKDRVLTRPRQ